MKLLLIKFRQSCILFMLVGVFFLYSNSFAQNGIIGAGFGTSDWDNTDCWNDGAGDSRIYTTSANGTGNQYFRLVTCWDSNWNQWGPSSTTEDLQISPNSAIGSSEVVENSTDKAYYIDVSSTSHNYVFKTRGGGNPPSNPALVVFCVQGTIASVSSVSQPTYVHPGDAVTITAGLSGSLSTGQAVYLRYTSDDWTNSTIVSMTGSGTSYSADIPAGANIRDQAVKYYVFTSGN